MAEASRCVASATRTDHPEGLQSGIKRGRDVEHLLGDTGVEWSRGLRALDRAIECESVVGPTDVKVPPFSFTIHSGPSEYLRFKGACACLQPSQLPPYPTLNSICFLRACVQGMSGHVVICLCSSSTSPASSYLWLEHLLIPLRRLISAPILLIGHNKGEPRQHTLTSAA